MLTALRNASSSAIIQIGRTCPASLAGFDETGRSAGQDPSVLEERWLDRSAEGLLIVPFPLDIKLPHLCRVVDPHEAERKLQESGLVSGSQSATAADVLRYVPGKRCQIRYHFCGRSEPMTLLGKTFKDDR